MDGCIISLEERDDDKLVYDAYTEDGQLAGMLRVGLYGMQYTIEGIFVLPEYRRRGIATGLLNSFLSIIDDEIMMPCTMTFTMAEGGRSLLGFVLDRKDFFLIDAGMSYRVSISKFLDNPIIKKEIDKGFSDNIMALEDLDEREIASVLDDLRSHELDVVSSVKELRERYDMHLSTACIKSGRILSAILIRRYEDREVIVDVMYANEKSFAVIETIARAAKVTCEADHDLVLSVFTVNEASERLADKLFENIDEAEKSHTFIAEWMMIPNMDVMDMFAFSGYESGRPVFENQD